jgi:hypothetical protein
MTDLFGEYCGPELSKYGLTIVERRGQYPGGPGTEQQGHDLAALSQGLQ